MGTGETQFNEALVNKTHAFICKFQNYKGKSHGLNALPYIALQVRVGYAICFFHRSIITLVV